MVRFKAPTTAARRKPGTVSIPKWYDSKNPCYFVEARSVVVSIPKWYDSKCDPAFFCPFSENVSIPKWYDSKTDNDHKLTFPPNVSIPKWYDSKGQVGFIGFARYEFQFPNGTIQRKHGQTDGRRSKMFQFPNGTIQSHLYAFCVQVII